MLVSNGITFQNVFFPPQYEFIKIRTHPSIHLESEWILKEVWNLKFFAIKERKSGLSHFLLFFMLFFKLIKFIVLIRFERYSWWQREISFLMNCVPKQCEESFAFSMELNGKNARKRDVYKHTHTLKRIQLLRWKRHFC